MGEDICRVLVFEILCRWATFPYHGADAGGRIDVVFGVLLWWA